jgi:hypothetical protein
MNNFDGFMEYFVAGVFLCAGLLKIWSYRRRPKALGAQRANLPFGLPYGSLVAVGLFEIAAAIALVMPFRPFPQFSLTELAIAGLAILTWTAMFYRLRRHEFAEPNMVLFLLVMFVAIARWV